MNAAPPADLTIRRVRSRGDWKAFHALPAIVRGRCEDWVRPLALQLRQMWAPRHPYFRHASAAAWVALRDGRCVGRISAQVDELQAGQGRPGRGEFGQLEAVDDASVFEVLTDTAQDWLRAQGMREMAGPFDLSINHQCGLLVEGFDRRPMMMMNHNPAYYPRRLESMGFEVAAETLAYRGSPAFTLPDRIARALQRMDNRLEIRPVGRRELSARAESMRELFNAAWAENWGFVPFTRDEFAHAVDEMKLLVRPGYVQIAFYDDQPAGFIVALPDLNELIADLDGRLFPTGAARLLWRIARRRATRARIPLMGIAPEHQQSYRAAAISYALIEAVRHPLMADGIDWTEQSWILADNRGMRTIVESIGMQVAQRFRLYLREIPA